MKKAIYQYAEKYYKTGRTAIEPAKVEAEKGIARAIRQELEDMYPATAPLNKEASKQIELGKVLEKAAGRVGNKELFSLFDFLGGTTGGLVGGGGGMAAGGFVSRIFTGPQTKSIIAKQIMRAQLPGPVKTDVLRQLSRYGTVKAVDKEPKP